MCKKTRPFLKRRSIFNLKFNLQLARMKYYKLTLKFGPKQNAIHVYSKQVLEGTLIFKPEISQEPKETKVI